MRLLAVIDASAKLKATVEFQTHTMTICPNTSSCLRLKSRIS